MNDKQPDDAVTILIRPRDLNRDWTALGKLGPCEMGAAILIDRILGGLDAALSISGLLKEDEDLIVCQRDLLETDFGPLIMNLRLLDSKHKWDSGQLLWRLLGACYQSGQLNPSRISKDILGQEFRKEQAEPANTARRADEIQKIIDSRASALWGRRPSFKDNFEGTATNIRVAVNRDLRSLQKKKGKKFPKEWIPAKDVDDADDTDMAAAKQKLIKKEIGRIARRVRDTHRPDN